MRCVCPDVQCPSGPPGQWPGPDASGSAGSVSGSGDETPAPGPALPTRPHTSGGEGSSPGHQHREQMSGRGTRTPAEALQCVEKD